MILFDVSFFLVVVFLSLISFSLSLFCFSVYCCMGSTRRDWVLFVDGDGVPLMSALFGRCSTHVVLSPVPRSCWTHTHTHAHTLSLSLDVIHIRTCIYARWLTVLCVWLCCLCLGLLCSNPKCLFLSLSCVCVCVFVSPSIMDTTVLAALVWGLCYCSSHILSSPLLFSDMHLNDDCSTVCSSFFSFSFFSTAPLLCFFHTLAPSLPRTFTMYLHGLSGDGCCCCSTHTHSYTHTLLSASNACYNRHLFSTISLFIVSFPHVSCFFFLPCSSLARLFLPPLHLSSIPLFTFFLLLNLCL
jgi:hypothetical protein